MSAPPYLPADRRPIATLFRVTAAQPVRACLRIGIHPDTISYASIFAAAGAGVMFWLSGRWPVLLLIAPGLCYLRLWFNMLDGMVAIAGGTASRRGEIVNDLPDRISDVLIFAGVAHSGLCHLASGYWAAIAALMTAYVGALGQAVGVRREFGGAMSKPWRMVTLHVGAWITLALIWLGGGNGSIQLFHLTVLDWTCMFVVLGCIQTCWVRLANTLRAL